MGEAEMGKIAAMRGIQRLVASSGDFFHSIKGKIFILFAVTFLSIGVLAGLNYWSLSTVSQRLLLGEKYDDLLNNILEVRRYEKNYFFYNDAKSLSEGIVYLERINALAGELAEDMTMSSSRLA